MPKWEKEIKFNPARAQEEFKTRQTRWITMNGRPSQETVFSQEHLSSVLTSSKPCSLGNLGFRDPKVFRAGEIHRHLRAWSFVLEGDAKKEVILHWLNEGVNVKHFANPFKGTFRGKHYNCDFSPAIQDYTTSTIVKTLQSLFRPLF
jgi:hypothetical protein